MKQHLSRGEIPQTISKIVVLKDHEPGVDRKSRSLIIAAALVALFLGAMDALIMSAAIVSPRRTRPSPVNSANRHGHVFLWFGAQHARSHNASIKTASTGRSRSINSEVRRSRIRAASCSKSVDNSAMTPGWQLDSRMTLST